MFLEVTNLSDLLKIIAEQAPAALHWLIGIVSTIGGGTIIAAIITIIKGIIGNKHLDSTISHGFEEFGAKNDERMDHIEARINETEQDNAFVGEMLLMIAAKSGFTPEEIVSVAKRYSGVSKSDKRVAEEIIENVNKDSLQAEEEAKAKAMEEAKVNEDIKALKSTEAVEEPQAQEQVEIKL